MIFMREVIGCTRGASRSGRWLRKEQADFGGIFDLGEHLVDGSLKYRVHPERVKLAQGHEHETALMQPGMRNHEIRFVGHPLAIEQDIEVDGPGA